jgi:hypothetical protein
MNNTHSYQPRAAAWMLAAWIATTSWSAWPQETQAPVTPPGAETAGENTNAPPQAPSDQARSQVKEARQVQGDLVLIGESGAVEANEVVTGDAVVIGGNLQIRGIVRGDAVCVGGHLTAGPNAWIGGDLVTVGGAAQIDAAAKVMGNKVNVAPLPLDLFRYLKPGAHPGADNAKAGHGRHNRGETVGYLLLGLLFFALLVFVALLMTAFLPAQFGRATEHIEGDFPRSALLGLTLMIVLPAALLALAVTIIGIPLIPLVVLTTGLGILVGYTAIAHALGRRLAAGKSPFLQTVVGLALLQAAAILGDVIGIAAGPRSLAATGFAALGMLIFIAGGFLGLGAIASSRCGRRTLAQSLAVRGPA